MRFRLSALLLAFTVLAVGCGDDGDDTAGTDGTTTSSSAVAATSSTAGDGEATTTTEVVCETDFDGGTAPQSTDPQGAPVYLDEVDVAVEEPSCVEQVVFDYSGTDAPGWQIEYGQPPFAGPSGEPVEVDGDAFLRLSLHGLSGVDLSGEEPRQTYTGPQEIRPDDATLLEEVQFISDFEAVMEWVIGLDRQRPYTVQVVDSSLVVTFGPV